MSCTLTRFATSFIAITLTLVQSYAQSRIEPNSGFVEEIILDKLPISTAVAFAPGGRIFIAQKEGIVRVAENGTLLTTPFIDISAITNRRTDRGLGGLALDPQFPNRPYVYLFFTYDPPERPLDETLPRVSRLVRVQADPTKNYNVAKAGTMEVILGKNSTAENMALQLASGATIIPEPASCMTGLTMDGTPIEDCIPSDEQSHSAGTVIFAPDGSLLASHGDGAPYSGTNKVSLRAQLLDSLGGKILRIDPNTGYGLPGNPFYDPTAPNSNRSKIWAYGMRNPFRITANPANGQVYAADVGSSTWEEINVGKGANFGWPCYEGGNVELSTVGTGNSVSRQSPAFSFSRTAPFCRALYNLGLGAVTPPLFSYKHPLDAQGRDLGASVTGVAFYAGTTYPEDYRGALFIADYAQHTIRRLSFNSSGFPTVHPFATENSDGGAVQLITGPDTNLYALFLNLVTRSSQLRRYRYTGSTNTPPTVHLHAEPTAGSTPLTVTFDTTGTVDPDGQELSYNWDFGDGSGATSSSSNPTHTYQGVGTFEAIVVVKETSAPFAEVSSSTTIRTGVTPPVVHITAPTTATTFAIGETIPFAGYAEYNGSPISESALTWTILQQHNLHEHLVNESAGVSSGAFIPTEHADSTRYIVCLSASLGAGLDDQQCVTIHPRTIPVTFASTPIGATISYLDEELDVIAPHIAHPIENSIQSISAAAVYAQRSFAGWSDGITTRERSFTVGRAPLTFSATYENRAPTARIIATPTGGATPFTVMFDGSPSSDPENSPLTYLWDLGGGDTATTMSASRTFPQPGSYLVTLTVTDALGLSHTTTMWIAATDPAHTNKPPVVLAPLPQTLPFNNPIALTGTVSDDGLPAAILIPKWSRVRGPGTITFANPNALSTESTFSDPGTYIVKLEATDSQLRASQNTAVTINPAETTFGITSFSLINAATGAVIPGYEEIQNGAIIPLRTLGTTQLNIRANTTGAGEQSVVFLQDAVAVSTDNTAPYALQSSLGNEYPAWSYSKTRYLITAVPYSGPGGTGIQGAALTVQFTLRDAVPTPSVPPTFTATVTPTATITPTPTRTRQNQPPTVDVDLAQTVSFGTTATLNGTATDDGLPSNMLKLLWTRVRGPGSITFASPSAATTEATFPLPGTYLYKFEATDTQYRSAKNGIISVNPRNAPFAVESFALINANTDQPFVGYESIPNGATIVLSALGTSPQINIRANVSSSTVKSIAWLRDALPLTADNNAPYSIQPSTTTDLPAWPYTTGLYRITAVPYAESNATGTMGAALSLQFVLR